MLLLLLPKTPQSQFVHRDDPRSIIGKITIQTRISLLLTLQFIS